MREWLPEGHLALFIGDVVRSLDLSAITATYLKNETRGPAAHHPEMMVTLLVYAYCVGKPSSRKIERATFEDVAFRVLSGDQHPDHDTIADFRKRYLKPLAALFVQVLALCREAGLTKLGHVALDGSKFQANASKHKAMSYGRMEEAEKKLQDEVDALLQRAARADEVEDAEFGKGVRGDELPRELARRESRLQKIREAKAALEARAKERAAAKAEEARATLAAREREEAESGKKLRGRPPIIPNPDEVKPEPQEQRNFTDPESRIMPDGAHKGAFVQGYNAQIAVDAHAQIIVACAVTQQANDKLQLVPIAEKIIESVGSLAAVTSADAGYFSEVALSAPLFASTMLLVPPNRQKHGASASVAIATDVSPESAVMTATERMRETLRTQVGRDLYKMRKAIVEPVFGQIKEVRGFRRFLLRGFENVCAEFDLIALTHNLLKLFRHGAPRALATS
jgi:transposase